MKDLLEIIGWLAILAGIVILGRHAPHPSIRALCNFPLAFTKAYLRGAVIVLGAAMIFWLVVGALELLGLL
jgi:hypothetical protein